MSTVTGSPAAPAAPNPPVPQPPVGVGDGAGKPPLGPLPTDVAQSISRTLQRRGFATTEWWTTILGLALSVLAARLGLHGPVATQVVAVGAPVILAATYAVVRSLQKSHYAALVDAAFPQYRNSDV